MEKKQKLDMGYIRLCKLRDKAWARKMYLQRHLYADYPQTLELIYKHYDPDFCEENFVDPLEWYFEERDKLFGDTGVVFPLPYVL